LVHDTCPGIAQLPSFRLENRINLLNLKKPRQRSRFDTWPLLKSLQLQEVLRFAQELAR